MRGLILVVVIVAVLYFFSLKTQVTTLDPNKQAQLNAQLGLAQLNASQTNSNATSQTINNGMLLGAGVIGKALDDAFSSHSNPDTGGSSYDPNSNDAGVDTI
jgi:hypothetical protein